MIAQEIVTGAGLVCASGLVYVLAVAAIELARLARSRARGGGQ